MLMEHHVEIRLPVASHTFHTSWKQCPRKAWHSYIAKDIEREDTAAMRWGTHVHKALDAFIGQGEPLPDELAHHGHLYAFPHGDYTVYSEHKLGIKEDGSACDFFAPDVYARGVLDVVLLPNRRADLAMLIDHKTGKVREEPDELQFHAVLLQAHNPLLRSIKGWYNWLAADKMGTVHDLSDTKKYLQRILLQQARIEQAFPLGSEAFPPRQSGLCPWCPVKQCEFHP